MERRDPRREPQCGDIVGDRWVRRRYQNDIYYRKRTASGGWGQERMCWITTWQAWAKDKEVKNVAE
jgi:hypothetical protein